MCVRALRPSEKERSNENYPIYLNIFAHMGAELFSDRLAVANRYFRLCVVSEKTYVCVRVYVSSRVRVQKGVQANDGCCVLPFNVKRADTDDGTQRLKCIFALRERGWRRRLKTMYR